ncbi:MAG: FAD-binding oxidoreductase [Nanoarchaeota archaeon]|nr:FAD-binding oxidoreductase [Nanoarchaeota archaeon]
MTNKKELICYSTDASRINGRAEKVLFPKTIKEVQEIIKLTNFDLVPRGAGTNFVGSTVPRDSLVVDMSKMNKTYDFNINKRTLIVEAGITLKELNEKLKIKGYEFPIDLTNDGISTIGGMIATNASGRSAMKYGSVRDWLEEVDFVNGRGELIKTSKADLMDVCGMEGITGIIVQAKLRLSPIIERSVSIYQTDKMEDLISVARRLKSEKDVVMLEFFPPYVSELLGLPKKYNLFIEFDSDRGKISGNDFLELSKKREKLFYSLASLGYYNVEDPKLFFDKFMEFMIYLKENRIPYVGYPGAGFIEPFFKDNEKHKRDMTYSMIKKTQGKLAKFGHGILKRNFIDSFERRVIERVKQRLDPNGKMNKGKIIEEFNPVTKRREDGLEKTRPLVTYSKKEEPSTIIISKQKEPVSTIMNYKSEPLKTIIQKPIEEPHERQIRDIIDKKEVVEPISDNIITKTPQEKLEELIEEAKKLEEKKIKMNIIDNERPIILVSKNNNELKERLKDYEDTYESELSQDKMKEVEKIAKNIPKEIARESILSERQKQKIDYKDIRNIMTNQYKSDAMNVAEKTKEVPKPIDNKDSDDDIINRILSGRFKKQEGSDKNDS